MATILVLDLSESISLCARNNVLWKFVREKIEIKRKGRAWRCLMTSLLPKGPPEAERPKNSRTPNQVWFVRRLILGEKDRIRRTTIRPNAVLYWTQAKCNRSVACSLLHSSFSQMAYDKISLALSRFYSCCERSTRVQYMVSSWHFYIVLVQLHQQRIFFVLWCEMIVTFGNTDDDFVRRRDSIYFLVFFCTYRHIILTLVALWKALLPACLD